MITHYYNTLPKSPKASLTIMIGLGLMLMSTSCSSITSLKMHTEDTETEKSGTERKMPPLEIPTIRVIQGRAGSQQSRYQKTAALSETSTVASPTGQASPLSTSQVQSSAIVIPKQRRKSHSKSPSHVRRSSRAVYSAHSMVSQQPTPTRSPRSSVSTPTSRSWETILKQLQDEDTLHLDIKNYNACLRALPSAIAQANVEEALAALHKAQQLLQRAVKSKTGAQVKAMSVMVKNVTVLQEDLSYIQAFFGDAPSCCYPCLPWVEKTDITLRRTVAMMKKYSRIAPALASPTLDYLRISLLKEDLTDAAFASDVAAFLRQSVDSVPQKTPQVLSLIGQVMQHIHSSQVGAQMVRVLVYILKKDAVCAGEVMNLLNKACCSKDPYISIAAANACLEVVQENAACKAAIKPKAFKLACASISKAISCPDATLRRLAKRVHKALKNNKHVFGSAAK